MSQNRYTAPSSMLRTMRREDESGGYVRCEWSDTRSELWGKTVDAVRRDMFHMVEVDTKAEVESFRILSRSESPVNVEISLFFLCRKSEHFIKVYWNDHDHDLPQASEVKSASH